MILVLTGSFAVSQVATAQGYSRTNRYSGGVGGERYSGSTGGERYSGGVGRAAPAPTVQPGRAGAGSYTSRGVAPAPLTRTTVGQPGQAGRSYQSAPVAAPVQALPVTPSIPSDAVHFSDLPTDSQFYFVADTSRSFLWIKTAENTASNTVNQKVSTKIPATIYVRPQITTGERSAARERTPDQVSVDQAYESRYGIPARRSAPSVESTNAPPAPANPQ